MLRRDKNQCLQNIYIPKSNKLRNNTNTHTQQQRNLRKSAKRERGCFVGGLPQRVELHMLFFCCMCVFEFILCLHACIICFAVWLCVCVCVSVACVSNLHWCVLFVLFLDSNSGGVVAHKHILYKIQNKLTQNERERARASLFLFHNAPPYTTPHHCTPHEIVHHHMLARQPHLTSHLHHQTTSPHNSKRESER